MDKVMQRFGKKLHLTNRERETEVVPPVPEGLAKVLEGCRRGSGASQKQLYDMLAPKMFSLCLRYMGDRNDAEDILQDGFVTLFSKLDSYSGEGSFEGWARKIFVNTALMSLRRNDALKMSDGLETAWEVRSDLATQLQNIGYKELTRMISSLPAGYRAVFNMYVIEGYSHREISEELGISEVTSRSQLSRARTMLQDMIKDSQ